MQIERHEIRVFSAVVEAGGFSRAAERLNVSQSAVSQTVANLEHKLDAQLLVRGGKPKLTEAGKRLLLEFCERNPLTRLKLDVAPSRELIYGVDEDRWELGIGPFQTQMPGHFTVRPFFDETRLLVAHENHPRFEALMRAPEEELKSATLLTSYLDDATKRPGSERLRNQFASVWEVSHLELRLALGEAGKGVTYISDRLLADLEGYHPIAGLETSTIARVVGLFHKKHQALSEGAKRFIAICQNQFQ